MSPILPRFYKVMEDIASAEKIGRILRETGDPGPVKMATRATAAGDDRRLRGIPCIARGVAGVSPGTQPDNSIR